MERLVKFADNQEVQAEDFTNIQAFARTSFDDLVNDVVTVSRRYAGFETQKTAQAEIQVGPGRFYDAGGGVYYRTTTLVQSMISYLPPTTGSKRIILVCVSGSEVDTNVQTRDFLVDSVTGRTEPDAVAMESSRSAVISMVQGNISADPQTPGTPSNSAAIASVLLDPTGVVSVTMIPDNSVKSTEALDLRTAIIEAFKSAIEPRVMSLAADIAALAKRIDGLGQNSNKSLAQVYQDVALLKVNAGLPADFANYGADNYQSTAHSDTANAAGLGYDCQISNGLTFNVAASWNREVALYSSYDANANFNDGLVLPAFDSVLKLDTLTPDAATSTHSISQYGYQTFDMVQKTITRYRLRYGPYWGWYYPYYYPWYYSFWGLWPDMTWSAYLAWYGAWPYAYYYYYYWYYPCYWYEAYTETYWDMEVVDHSILGAQVAQTWLNANDMWCTGLGIYISTVGAANPVYVSICELTAGQPDIKKLIAHTMIDGDKVKTGWNVAQLQPTFLKGGTRYGAVFTSEANHQVQLVNGQSYLDGTLFWSTDTEYYTGDLTNDLRMQIYGAQFKASQTTIQFNSLSLDGGILAIDLLGRAVVPDGCQLFYEVQPEGGDWQAITSENISILNPSSPPTSLYFRGRFVGTKDVAAGVQLAGSKVTVSRPKVTFKHVSSQFTITSVTTLAVKVRLTNFQDDGAGTPHSCTVRLHIGSDYITGTVADALVDAATKTYERTVTFTTDAFTQFRVVIDGTTTSAGYLFTVADMVYWTA